MKKWLKKVWWFVLPFLLPIAILVIWEIAGITGHLQEHLLPRPTKIFVKLIDLTEDGTIPWNLFVSFRRIIAGYLIGAGLGVVLGVICGLSKIFHRATKLLLDLLRPIPIMVWIPVLILCVGIYEKSKIIVIAIATFWPVLLNVTDGILTVEKKYIEVSKIFMKSKTNTIFKVILPAAAPSMITGLKIASGNAVMSVVAAEMFAASSGIGYMISFAREMSQPVKMYAGVIVIAIVGWLLNLFLLKSSYRSAKSKKGNDSNGE